MKHFGRIVFLMVTASVVAYLLISYRASGTSSSSSSSSSSVPRAVPPVFSDTRVTSERPQGGSTRAPPQHTIALKFKGRIGNQMFMFASLLGIAEANNLRPVIPENLELLNYFEFTTEKVKNYGSGRKLYAEKSGLSYEDAVMKLGEDKDIVLDGYYQSWRYFKHVEAKLRKEFTFRREIRDKAQRQIDDVTKGKCQAPSGGCVYMGVHVRRGDMVHTKVFVDYGYISADKDYLDTALDHFRKKFPQKAVFVVLSDDTAWCQKNIAGNDVAIVTSKNPAYLDLAMLAALNHTAMTVGSYGWWGAWLAGGDVTYYKGYPRPGTTLYRLMNQTDYRYPGSIPL